MSIELIRDIKISILEGKYKCISAYKIPNDIEKWKNCKKCGLKPLTWTFNNGASTACGCGESEYRHFSIHTESIMSHIKRNNGSALHYNSNKLLENWNHWVDTNEELETHQSLIENGYW